MKMKQFGTPAVKKNKQLLTFQQKNTDQSRVRKPQFLILLLSEISC